MMPGSGVTLSRPSCLVGAAGCRSVATAWHSMLKSNNTFFSCDLLESMTQLTAITVCTSDVLLTHPVLRTGAGNTGNLPLVIVSTLARTSAEILGGVDPRTAEVRAQRLESRR